MVSSSVSNDINIHRILADDPNPHVRLYLAHNSDHKEINDKLMKDEWQAVKNAAGETYNNSPKLSPKNFW